MTPTARTALALLVAASLAGGLAACSRQDGAPAATASQAEVARPSRQYGIEEFVESIGVSGASFSADESRILFSSNRSGIWNVYSMPVTGGEWTAVTASSTDNNYAVAYFPHDDRVLVTRDQGGNELNHLYVIETDGSERDLTPGEKLKAMFAGFSHDGSRFFVLSNERDPRYFDVYAYDATTYARERIYTNEAGYQPGPISGDGRWIGLSKPDTTVNNDIYLFDRQSGALTHLSPHQGAAQFAIQDFAPDGSHLLYTSNDGSEFFRLRRYDLASGEHADVQVEDWDIVYSHYSHNGRYRIAAINEDGSTSVRLYDAASGERLPLPALPAGEIRGATLARSEARLAFYLNGDRQPNDLYVLEFGGAPKQLTRSLNPAIDPADLVDSQVVRFTSFDGMEIPNILWKPHQATAENKAPALVWVHGGPGGQTTRAHSAVIQYLANHGYVVLGINNRGSSGYGKTFFAADDRKHGREPLWDTIEAKKYLQSLDYVDPERIGIIGGSYGGYMVLSALAFHPEEFDVGVNIFGVSNWIRTLESIPPWWESFRQALYAEIGHPEKDREFLIATSPLFHADNIVKPLIVLQGANDPRVIQAESDDIVAAVRRNEVPVEYVVFDDEGHGFTKKKNQIAGYGAILAFLDTHLKHKPATP
ncbi:S9 family peptidase [Rehaibacterium terrae]|uniref:Acyl-peptide hydrolase n=1 Tax=Rehaibacterium terrae TaxID=1341696 RepID=A0A7W7V6I8_9GAMM|nr:alpha/beta fold hydrolase [Rehaibacterium terrae]MBB5014172.1 dipeptidyl aminopeptidase/acylaminoacyl peptidase [Rehaibacterium terrae]